MRHHKGTTLAFADGHSESWGWTDPRTIEYGNEPWDVSESGTGVDKHQPGNPDLMKVQKGAWGGWDTDLREHALGLLLCFFALPR